VQSDDPAARRTFGRGWRRSWSTNSCWPSSGSNRRRAWRILLVDQHVRIVLEFSPDVIVLERGRIAFAGPSTTLLGDDALMASLLGVKSEPRPG